MPNVVISENFDDPKGRYQFYDTDPNSYAALQARRHVNLRSFYNDTKTSQFFMANLNLSQTALNALTMTNLESSSLVAYQEPWSVGTLGTTTQQLSVSCSVGTNTTVSSTQSIDIKGMNEFVVSFTQFDATKLDLATTNVVLAQGAQSVTLPFSSATQLTSGLFKGFSWPLSALGAVTAPDTITFNFVATAIVTVILRAIRGLVTGWTPTNVDINTVNQRMEATVDRNGTVIGTPHPILWRAGNPPGHDDPRPVNARLGVVFNSGSRSTENRISLYFRGRSEDFLTQLDLDGDPNQSLDALKHQPNYGKARYNSRPQIDLKGLTQTTLDTKSQYLLERTPDTISQAWMAVNLYFGGASERVVISTTENANVFTKTTTFANKTPYLMVVEVEDNSIRVLIYPLLTQGAIDPASPLLDTKQIVNPNVILRRKGRIGWQFLLPDGDAYIDSIRSRGMMFGEVITNPLESFTPVEGAQVFLGGTPNRQVPLNAGGFGAATLAPDLHNAQSPDGSVKVTAPTDSGLETALAVFEDFAHSEIVFDLYYPETAIENREFLEIRLANEENFEIPLSLGSIVGDRWQTVRIRPLQAATEQSGLYRVRIVQLGDNTHTWWVDNLYVQYQTVALGGRTTIIDGLYSPWVDFLNLRNSDTDGVLFPQRGTQCQVRAQAITQEAKIDKLYIKPKYAQLGRLVWS